MLPCLRCRAIVTTLTTFVHTHPNTPAQPYTYYNNPYSHPQIISNYILKSARDRRPNNTEWYISGLIRLTAHRFILVVIRVRRTSESPYHAYEYTSDMFYKEKNWLNSLRLRIQYNSSVPGRWVHGDVESMGTLSPWGRWVHGDVEHCSLAHLLLWKMSWHPLT